MTLPMQPLVSVHEAVGDLAERSSTPTLDGTLVAQTYRIERTIPASGASQLLYARHIRLGHRVLVKTLSKAQAADPTMRARFVREATSLGRIHSPHVVRILDVDDLPDGRPCLITELLDGIDLQQHLRSERTLNALDTLQIAEDIAAGLVATHQARMFHRDVKPANIVLIEDPGLDTKRATLIDFGIAAWEDNAQRITRPGAIIGTPTYMPPEQACGVCADARSDVYALGAVIYRMVTGRPPHAGTDARQVLRRVREVDPRRPGSIAAHTHPELCAIIERAMARNPDERFESMHQMHEALNALRLRLLQKNARPATAFSPQQKPKHRFYLGIATAIGTATATALMLAGWALYS